MVVFPGLAPRESSSALGLVSLLAAGVSSAFFVLALSRLIASWIWSQLSRLRAVSMSKTRPVEASLSTSWSRLTRNTGSCRTAWRSSGCGVAAALSQERARAPGVPAHAAYTQGPSRVGAAGAPVPAANSGLTSPSPIGTLNRPLLVAITTTSAAGPGCCSRVAGSGSPSDTLRSPIHRVPVDPSRATTVVPTADSWSAFPPPERSVTTGVSKPLAVGRTVTSLPPDDAAYTLPSRPTVMARLPPTEAAVLPPVDAGLAAPNSMSAGIVESRTWMSTDLASAP
ncbi:MAG: hypothetical protein BWY91_00430 [bacterium ADurb.BinA028]|nr:MAG: hypothetical protein BWY91_00430 [bacterium ADurb.BinA028]